MGKPTSRSARSSDWLCITQRDARSVNLSDIRAPAFTVARNVRRVVREGEAPAEPRQACCKRDNPTDPALVTAAQTGRRPKG